MLKFILGLLGGGGAATELAGGAINTVATIAAVAPVAIWFVTHKDEAFVTLSYGETAVIGLIVFGVIKAAHYTRAPGT